MFQKIFRSILHSLDGHGQAGVCSKPSSRRIESGQFGVAAKSQNVEKHILAKVA